MGLREHSEFGLRAGESGRATGEAQSRIHRGQNQNQATTSASTAQESEQPQAPACLWMSGSPQSVVLGR